MKKSVRGASVAIALGIWASLGAQPTPPATLGVVLAATGTSIAPPVTHVDVVFHGLVAFVPLGAKKEDGMKSLFFSPSGHEHVPYATVATGAIHESNKSKPDFIVAGENGTGLAVWKFKSVEITDNIVANMTPPFDYNSDKLLVNETNFDKLRWVPALDDIFPSEKHDPTEEGKAAAVAEWKAGYMSPEFDDEDHKKEKWDINKREQVPLADGVRLRLKLANAGKPTVLRLNGGAHEIPLYGGTTVHLSAYPKVVPIRGVDDMAHFSHFYALRKRPNKGQGPRPTRSRGPSPEPVRCAPMIVVD